MRKRSLPLGILSSIAEEKRLEEVVEQSADGGRISIVDLDRGIDGIIRAAEESKLEAENSSNADWEFSLEEGKAALNQLALNDLREAPFLQWALVSLEQSLTFACQGDCNASLSYLQMSFQALQYAKELLASPLHSGGGLGVSRHLHAAIAYLDDAFDMIFQYRLDKHRSRISRGRQSLEAAVQEIVAASEIAG